jgi:hypothetical protein
MSKGWKRRQEDFVAVQKGWDEIDWSNNMSKNTDNTAKSISNDDNNKERLLEQVMKEIAEQEKADKLSYAELAAYLIENFWANEDFSSEKSAIINRIIEIMFELSEKDKPTQCCGGSSPDCKCK